eukprot:g30351.t1
MESLLEVMTAVQASYLFTEDVPRSNAGPSPFRPFSSVVFGLGKHWRVPEHLMREMRTAMRLPVIVFKAMILSDAWRAIDVSSAVDVCTPRSERRGEDDPMRETDDDRQRGFRHARGVLFLYRIAIVDPAFKGASSGPHRTSGSSISYPTRAPRARLVEMKLRPKDDRAWLEARCCGAQNDPLQSFLDETDSAKAMLTDIQ